MEVKRAESAADHSLPPGADVKNDWSHTSAPPPPPAYPPPISTN